MIKWRKIETEGLPLPGKKALWWHKNGYFRLWNINLDRYVTWDNRYVNVTSFTHWAYVHPPKD